MASVPHHGYCSMCVTGDFSSVFCTACGSLPCVQALEEWICHICHVVGFGISQEQLRPISLTRYFRIKVVFAKDLSNGPVQKYIKGCVREYVYASDAVISSLK